MLQIKKDELHRQELEIYEEENKRLEKELFEKNREINKLNADNNYLASHICYVNDDNDYYERIKNINK
jgi:predicted RNase H-like nuclease (RuvC/YqgF family)